MTVKADNSLKGGHLISLRPMNNATQTDVSGHSLVAQDMAREGREGGAAGQPIIPGHSGRTPDFEIFVFLSDLFLSLLMPSYAIMRWIWAALSSSTFSCNTSDVNWEGGGAKELLRRTVWLYLLYSLIWRLCNMCVHPDTCNI